ncbi:MAG: ATP-binding protein [Bacteroidetes bacterium]|nr:ATP-binding protein [Bacteroidota bacterium]
MNTSISTFIQYLRVKKYFSIKKVDEPKSKANILVNTLAPKILTSEEDLKRVRPYLDSLKQAIETNGINNIAVTGSYGSGKSTILKTFQNQNEKKSKFLNISLASFSDNIDDTEIERKIEVSILQQMFYHVKPSVIPDSRFKRIDNISQKNC